MHLVLLSSIHPILSGNISKNDPDPCPKIRRGEIARLAHRQTVYEREWKDHKKEETQEARKPYIRLYLDGHPASSMLLERAPLIDEDLMHAIPRVVAVSEYLTRHRLSS